MDTYIHGGLIITCIECEHSCFENLPGNYLMLSNAMCVFSSSPVPPALSSNVNVSNITGFQVQVTWTLTHQHADERAESLTLTVQFSNGTIAQQYQLEGNVTQQMVDTVPGMEYLVTVSVFNQDGTNTTDPVSFQTPSGRKYLDTGTQIGCILYNFTQ